MTDAIIKRRENGRRYSAALASWNALDAGSRAFVHWWGSGATVRGTDLAQA